MKKFEENDPGKFRDFMNADSSALKVIFFYSEDSPECNQINDVLREFMTSEDFNEASFYMVDANKQEEISKTLNVSSVPCVIFEWKNESERLVGADVPALVKIFKSSYTKALATGSSDSEQDLNSRLRKLINKSQCMLFMKGSPETPRCGFSKQVIALLKSHNAKFETFDILEDNEVRQGLKVYSNWPTYPQLYVSGDLVGGIDILKEMSSNGELDEILPKV